MSYLWFNMCSFLGMCVSKRSMFLIMEIIERGGFESEDVLGWGLPLTTLTMPAQSSCASDGALLA